jgi:hypothetical protein
MRIVKDFPPNYEAIAARFDITESVIFAYGDVIYNPSGGIIPPSVMAHEQVHGTRQGADVEWWWKRYLDDDEFRLFEEIQSHRAEYKYLYDRTKDRNARAKALHIVAARLVAPLYGYGHLITHARAKAVLSTES